MKISVYIANASENDAPSFNTADNARGYAQLFKELIFQGGEVFVVFDSGDNYLGNGVFKQSWQAVLEDGEITYKKIDTPVETDLLFDKAHFSFDDMKVINPRIISDICRDKYLSYLFAPDFSSPSFLLENEDQLLTLRRNIKDGKIAIKELVGCGGSQVYVGPLSGYKDALNYPLLAQEFIDTSKGFPGPIDGTHDVRVGILNGKVIHGLLRWPTSRNELRTNLHLGGKIKALYVSEIPQELIKITQELDSRFGVEAPRFFSADFGFDGKNWRLFELNSFPGIWSRETFGPASDEYLHLLAEGILSGAKNKNK